jgi:ornithine cyclodeaminase/alanine dehydrogenase-like protein (mu-crystallin family)
MIPVIDGPQLEALVPVDAAISALREALRSGAATTAGPPRVTTPVRAGHLLLMPAENTALVGVKITGVAPDNPFRGLPRITGTYLVHDAATLQPLAAIDGAALTLLRTAALSALAVAELATASASRLLVYGTGPQAAAHIHAVATVRSIDEVAVAGRTPESTAAFVRRWDGESRLRPATPNDVEGADLVVCCTSSSVPLFDGRRLPPHATVVAMGSHTLDARELDTHTIRRSTVVVEDRDTALREAADVTVAVRAGDAENLLTLTDVLGGTPFDGGRPRVFRSVGMAWEDLAVAAAALHA